MHSNAFAFRARSRLSGSVIRHVHLGLGFFCAAILCPLFANIDFDTNDGTILAPIYAREVDRRLNVPESVQRFYAQLLAKNLGVEVSTPDSPPDSNDETSSDVSCNELPAAATSDAGCPPGRRALGAQYVIIVDRNKFVQAAMIYWMSPDGEFHFIGASPVSTGRPGNFDHFVTPTGVFEHTIDNLDFRAEGTLNEFGIRGYGRKGMRVYDFGWQQARKGWGGGGESEMRLQMHATDPDFLAQRLGTVQSKGCIRIPATLNAFIDHYGILDGDYERAMAAGMSFWVLRETREPTPWSGRFLVVVDTGRTTRPAWAVPLRK
jgi:hypothetical protein